MLRESRKRHQLLLAAAAPRSNSNVLACYVEVSAVVLLRSGEKSDRSRGARIGWNEPVQGSAFERFKSSLLCSSRGADTRAEAGRRRAPIVVRARRVRVSRRLSLWGATLASSNNAYESLGQRKELAHLAGVTANPS